MSSLYIITGPAGVGKSTISERIAKSKSKSVLIEGDDIYHQVICITLLNSFKNNTYNEENILDTTNLSIDETVNMIETNNRFIL